MIILTKVTRLKKALRSLTMVQSLSSFFVLYTICNVAKSTTVLPMSQKNRSQNYHVNNKMCSMHAHTPHTHTHSGNAANIKTTTNINIYIYI